MFSKKDVSKNLEKFSGKYLCRSQEILVQAFSCEFCGIFKNIFFAEHLPRHTCVKGSNEKFSDKFICCRHEGLVFNLKGTQPQILSCRICEVLHSFRTLLTTGQLLLICSNIFDVSLSLSAIYQFSYN